MNAQHTPGPWKFDGDGFDSVAAQDYDGDGYVVFPMKEGDVIPGTAICELCPSGNDAQDAANAALIAAAPDLLQALQNFENDDGSIPASIWKLRNDAIARATA